MTRRSVAQRAAVVTTATLVAVATVTAGVSLAGHNSPKRADKAQIAGLFDTWNAALQTGDSQQVADLYAKDAVLLPTVSNQVRTDRAQIVDYFDHFLRNKPVGKKVETIVTVLDGNSAVDTGVYAFTLTDHDTGEKRVVKARYTYTYEKVDGAWLIFNHHSSAMPQG
ncbi:SgcJ/EcaC family oxidoreductase [Streptomyces sp. NPDC003011]